MQNIVFTSKGIYCPPGDFYIDPWKPVERAVITHAHADHARQGMQKYLCHEHSLPLLRSRISTGIIAEALPYGKSITINGVSVSLHPAGHVIGSAQVRIEYKGYTTVISGDYKRQDDRITPVFEVVPCHEFVTESTFGLPVYRWEPPGQMVHKIRKWVLDNQRENK
ncbi:MAG: DNA ligase-associated DEXH box helicase, partial [Bacteroidota bacterium]